MFHVQAVLPLSSSLKFVQDLRAINTVIPRCPVVSNPHILLSAIPPKSTTFTVIDLHSAFFSIPVDPKSQYLFAFTWENQQFTWTVIPQGYTESPTYFLQILKADTADVTIPQKSSLL